MDPNEVLRFAERSLLAARYAAKLRLGACARALLDLIVQQRSHVGYAVKLTETEMGHLTGFSERMIRNGLRQLRDADLIFFGRGTSGRFLHIMLARKFFPQAPACGQDSPKPRTRHNPSTIRPSFASQRKRDPLSDTLPSGQNFLPSPNDNGHGNGAPRPGGWMSAADVMAGMVGPPPEH